jgi:hypothetical protein
MSKQANYTDEGDGTQLNIPEKRWNVQLQRWGDYRSDLATTVVMSLTEFVCVMIVAIYGAPRHLAINELCPCIS